VAKVVEALPDTRITRHLAGHFMHGADFGVSVLETGSHAR
jgi:hypothetical protein